MAVPAMPGTGLVVIEAQFVFGGLETVLDGPAMPFDPNQRRDAGSGGTPSGEESEVTIGDVAADQKAARPKAGLAFAVCAGIQIRQFQIGPVIEARPFGAFPRGQAFPSR